MHERITTRVRRSLQGMALSGEKLNARINEIRAALKNWIPGGGMDSLRWIELLQAYHILPFPGSLSEQPQWFIDDMENYLLWIELETLNQRRTTLPPGTPGVEQVTGNRNAR